MKAHHLIQFGACLGLIHPCYVTWAVVLSKDSGPHKFFQHLVGDTISVDESNTYFQMLLKRMKSDYCHRITASLLENLLCELDRRCRNKRKKDLIFKKSCGLQVQDFYRIWKRTTTKYAYYFQKYVHDKWSDKTYPFIMKECPCWKGDEFGSFMGIPLGLLVGILLGFLEGFSLGSWMGTHLQCVSHLAHEWETHLSSEFTSHFAHGWEFHLAHEWEFNLAYG